MKPSLLIIFTLLFLAVLGIYVVVDNTAVVTQEAKVEEHQEAVSLLNLDEGDFLTRIQIRSAQNQQVFALAKKEDRWMIVDPIEYPADPMLAGGIETALTVAEKVRSLKRDKTWTEYGLDKPGLEVAIRTQKKPQDRILYFGGMSPTSNLVYARWSDSQNEFFLLSVEMKAALSQSLYSLRSKKIFDLAGRSIAKIRIQTPNGDFEISRHQDKWFWMEPIPILGEFVDVEDFKNLWSNIDQLYVKEFYDDPFVDISKFGIREGCPSIAVFEEGKEDTAAHVLQVGSEIKTQDSFYAKRKDLDSPYLVSATNLAAVFSGIQKMANKLKPKEKNPLGLDIRDDLAPEIPEPGKDSLTKNEGASAVQLVSSPSAEVKK